VVDEAINVDGERVLLGSSPDVAAKDGNIVESGIEVAVSVDAPVAVAAMADSNSGPSLEQPQIWPPKCQSGHIMVRHVALPDVYKGTIDSVFCGSCRREHLVETVDVDGYFHHCSLCRYDLCSTCVPDPTATAAKTTEDPISSVITAQQSD
jgi:hypothetical protein